MLRSFEAKQNGDIIRKSPFLRSNTQGPSRGDRHQRTAGSLTANFDIPNIVYAKSHTGGTENQQMNVHNNL